MAWSIRSEKQMVTLVVLAGTQESGSRLFLVVN